LQYLTVVRKVQIIYIIDAILSVIQNGTCTIISNLPKYKEE